MDISLVTNFITNNWQKLHNYFGYKIIPYGDFDEETVLVDMNYPDKSEKSQEEIKNGAKFCWSDKYRVGFEKYYEIDGNIKRYFKADKSGNLLLWVKRQ